ncbi:UNVERIFIED_CONTAM: Retrovirus-related Pol polyprotein from transposon TNT 1-94 [Sesamum latifolium]|uniref:Retrovirus-related Pol polyprotein from transposon TNT 1-94 n=1 Tax=Sesamum latifolium TaxID=2727402 RepID=A0AAW2S2E7_9LAMI
MMCTRPDLCFAVGMVSRYQSNPGADHWVAVKRILRYLKGTSDLALCYHGEVEGWLDIVMLMDQRTEMNANPHQDMHSYWEALLSLGAARSSLASLCLPWKQNMLLVHQQSKKLSATIAYAKDPKYHGRTKHIDTRYHFIRDSIAQGEVILRHIPTNDMIPDPFTKPLRRDAFHRHMSSMGLRRI